MHKAFLLLVRKFPLPEGTSHGLKINATVRRIEMPLPEVCTASEEKKKKLPVKDFRKNTTQSTQISKINDLIGKIIPCSDLSSRNVPALSAKCP
nr:hypothetical protein [Tanacetum cinerariifolium]